jgi:Tfp pilus assembly protein PilV
LPCNKNGISIIEVIIALFLTTIGIMALLALQPTGWKAMAKADYVGRASGILYKTLEDNENMILNPCNLIAMGTTTANVESSDQATAINGDIKYLVTTTIAQDGTSGAGLSTCIVTVTVSWPPLNTTGISDSMVVSRQEAFRYKAGCPNAFPP